MVSSVAYSSPESKPDKKQFRFFVNSDSQMGPVDTTNKALKILNELLEHFISEVNQAHSKNPIDFVVYNGDLVWDPYQNAFDNFIRIVSKQVVPTMLVHGNHDGFDNDPKFFEAQKKLSGFEKLNYSFDYGNWHFVVIGSQEKYRSDEAKKQQIAWLENDLKKNADKKVMLFMHYHILPVGLSQMEFYSLWPNTFKKNTLDTLTKFGNVKYVFNGHVHSGVKASIKSSLEYKGIKFINVPTPVMARPFGEEFSEYENDPSDRYFRRGFYLEVKVDGDDVKLIGHKINHDFSVQYPNQFNKFVHKMEPRFLSSEGKIKPNKTLKNPSFDNQLEGWETSYRYEKDQLNSFVNFVQNGSNILWLRAPWGSWNFDEYMETYQVVDLKKNVLQELVYDFETPNFSQQGGGGFIKLNFFNEKGFRLKTLILHWGAKEERVKIMQKSWFYNADESYYINFEEELVSGKIIFMPLFFDNLDSQVLSININHFLTMGKTNLDNDEVSHFSVSHGVWSRLLKKESQLFSKLVVKSVNLRELDDDGALNSTNTIMINNKVLDMEQKDKVFPYFQYQSNKK